MATKTLKAISKLKLLELNQNLHFINKNQLKIRGEHNVSNALAAMALAETVDVPKDVMTGVLKDVIPFGLSFGNRNFLKGINIIGLKRNCLLYTSDAADE